MAQRLLSFLLVLTAAAPLGRAEGPGGYTAAEFGRPAMQRLPPVEALPLPDAEAVPPPAVPEVEQPIVQPFVAVKLWEGSFELGLDGTEGNSQTSNLRFGLDAERTAPLWALALDLDYRRSTSDTRETAHRGLFDWRCERLLPDSPWSGFVHGTVDYDELKMFDLRVTADMGLGYRFVETESSRLAGQFGGGFSHEIGGPDDAYVPEATFGLEFEHQINERQRLTASVRYMPDVSSFDDYRLTTEAGWEVLIDRQMNLSLKLGVLDRYDSTPGGAKPNDLDYAATLLWRF